MNLSDIENLINQTSYNLIRNHRQLLFASLGYTDNEKINVLQKNMVSEIIIAISPEALQKQLLSWAHTFQVTM